MLALVTEKNVLKALSPPTMIFCRASGHFVFESEELPAGSIDLNTGMTERLK